MSVNLPPDIETPDDAPMWVTLSQARREGINWSNEEELRGIHHRNDVLWHKSYWVIVVIMMWSFFSFLSLFWQSTILRLMNFFLAKNCPESNRLFSAGQSARW